MKNLSRDGNDKMLWGRGQVHFQDRGPVSLYRALWAQHLSTVGLCLSRSTNQSVHLIHDK